MGYQTGHGGRGSGCAVLPASRPGRGSAPRQARGRLANLSGAMAEDAALRRLEASGVRILARRWRGACGEIDLVGQDGNCVVFVEVKQGRTMSEAALRLGRRQMDRICAAASEYCMGLAAGMSTEMRFDVALVDATGRVEVLANAFAEA